MSAREKGNEIIIRKGGKADWALFVIDERLEGVVLGDVPKCEDGLYGRWWNG